MEHDSHPLAYAVERGDIELVVALIRERGDAFDVNANFPPLTDSAGQTLLVCAVHGPGGPVPSNQRTENRSDLVRLLCAHGANVNAIGTWMGTTALFHCQHAEEAEVLLDHGADVNYREQFYGVTPLKNCADKNLKLVRLLVRRGAHIPTMAWLDLRRRSRVKPDVADFLEGVHSAGSYAAYVRAPRKELVRLRTLCARGRAAPPRDRILERLFCNPTETGARRASKRRRPLPNEVFWHILGFWRTQRETGAS